MAFLALIYQSCIYTCNITFHSVSPLQLTPRLPTVHYSTKQCRMDGACPFMRLCENDAERRVGSQGPWTCAHSVEGGSCGTLVSSLTGFAIFFSFSHSGRWWTRFAVLHVFLINNEYHLLSNNIGIWAAPSINCMFQRQKKKCRFNFLIVHMENPLGSIKIHLTFLQYSTSILEIVTGFLWSSISSTNGLHFSMPSTSLAGDDDGMCHMPSGRWHRESGAFCLRRVNINVTADNPFLDKYSPFFLAGFAASIVSVSCGLLVTT